MAGKSRASARPQPQEGKTGRYFFCPASGAAHELVAKQLNRSRKGNVWARCSVCGVRVYFPPGVLPRMTKADALQAGARIPDELF